MQVWLVAYLGHTPYISPIPSYPMLASDEQIRSFLTNPGKLAVIGARPNTDRPSYYVPKFLEERGFELLPINKFVDEVYGVPTLADLDDLPVEVVGVIIYQLSHNAEKQAIRAVDKGIPFIWLPEGVTSAKAESYANQHNIPYIHDRCPMPESRRLGL